MSELHGIYIGNKRITALSGVYSTVYMKPIPSVFNHLLKFEIQLPLILLLGDKHFGKGGMCTDCSCQDGDCCELYDPLFLKELDSLSSDQYPIDFYTETFFSYLENSGGPSDHFTSEEFRICYDRSTRNTLNYLNQCPTKSIRWHHADIRQSLYTPTHENTLEASFVALRHFFAQDMSYLDKIDLSVIELLMTLYNEKTKEVDTHQFSETFYTLILRENSIIKKEMKKQSYEMLRDRAYMGMMLEKGLDYIFEHNTLDFTHFNEMLRIVFSIRHEQYYPDLTNHMEGMKQAYIIMTCINCIFMDIYFILRCFKTPIDLKKKSRQASLCIAFFGQEHSNTICYLLTEVIRFYTVSFSAQHTQKQVRCTPIHETVDLVSDLLYHNQNREQDVEYDMSNQNFGGMLFKSYRASKKKKRSCKKYKK
jgi:hypothetical protein